MPKSPDLLLFSLAQSLFLLFAWLMGRGAYAIVKRRVKMKTVTVTVISWLGVCLGFALVGIFVKDAELLSPITIAVAFGTNLLVLTVLSAVTVFTVTDPQPPAIAEQAGRGESDRLEFKSSARVNMATGQRDDRMEFVIAKTVAAFCNAQGGTLLIGVDDSGNLVGLEPDFATLKQPDPDHFELWLRDLLHNRLGTNTAALPVVDFASTPEGSYVCRLRCPPATGPVFLRKGKGQSAVSELWVRVGNSTRSLVLDDAVEYITQRWPTPLSVAVRAQLRSKPRRSTVHN